MRFILSIILYVIYEVGRYELIPFCSDDCEIMSTTSLPSSTATTTAVAAAAYESLGAL